MAVKTSSKIENGEFWDVIDALLLLLNLSDNFSLLMNVRIALEKSRGKGFLGFQTQKSKETGQNVDA